MGKRKGIERRRGESEKRRKGNKKARACPFCFNRGTPFFVFNCVEFVVHYYDTCPLAPCFYLIHLEKLKTPHYSHIFIF